MTIPTDKALAVGKVLYPDPQLTWSEHLGRVIYFSGDREGFGDFDPTTASECWAMARYAAARTANHGRLYPVDVAWALCSAIEENDPAALIDLVLAVGEGA
jgi:hypothetical protein